MLYAVDGSIPAANRFEGSKGLQAFALGYTTDRPPTLSMVSRIKLPAGQAGARPSATSGLAVGDTAKVPPVLKGFSVKAAEVVAVSWDWKSLAITFTR